MTRHPRPQIILWLTVLLGIGVVSGIAIWSRVTNGLWPSWTGIGEYDGPQHNPDQLFQREKTIWDWLQLLVVPVALAMLVFWLNGRRAQTDREIAEERSQDELVEKYLELISKLLLDHDLRNSERDSEKRNVARARTLDVLRRLKPARKPDLLRFLYASDLITHREGWPIISLHNADLSNADFERYSDVSEEIHWQKVNLSGACLIGAKFDWCHLEGVSFEEADLTSASLQHAYLDPDESLWSNATLDDANLQGARMESGDKLLDAKEVLEVFQKAGVRMFSTIMPNGSRTPARAPRGFLDRVKSNLWKRRDVLP